MLCDGTKLAGMPSGFGSTGGGDSAVGFGDNTGGDVVDYCGYLYLLFSTNLSGGGDCGSALVTCGALLGDYFLVFAAVTTAS